MQIGQPFFVSCSPPSLFHFWVTWKACLRPLHWFPFLWLIAIWLQFSPFKTKSPRSQMTSFWLTRESLCPLWPSCLIRYPWSFFLLGFCGSTPLWLSIYLFLLLFQYLLEQLLLPSPWDFFKATTDSCFLIVQFFWLVFCYYSQAEYFRLPVLFVSILWVELTVWCIQDDSLSPEGRMITGNSLIWTCHCSSSFHCCWQLHNSPSSLKLRVSFDIPLHVPVFLDNHGRLAARPEGVRGFFLVFRA